MRLLHKCHFLTGSDRGRADFALKCQTIDVVCELYSDFAELVNFRPKSGLIVVRDEPEMISIRSLDRRLINANIDLPWMAASEVLEVGRIVAAVRSGAIDYISLPLDAKQFHRRLEQISDDVETCRVARRAMIDAKKRLSSLSKREGQVLDRIYQGNSNIDIAKLLEISPRTVEIHRANLMRKLQASHVSEAIRLRAAASPVGIGAN